MKISTKQALLFTLINYVGVLIGIVSTVLIYPQDKEMLGIIRFIDACAQMMFPLIVLGSTHALINFYPTLREELKSKLFSYSLLSLVKMAGIVAAVIAILFFTMKGDEVKYILIAFPLAFALACIELFRRQATNMQKIAFPTFFEKIIPKIALPSVFLLAYFGVTSLNSSLVLYIAAYYVVVIIVGSYIYKHFKYKWYSSYKDLFSSISKKDYYTYSFFAFAGSFGSFFAFRVDSLMIPSFISFEANGTYTIGVTLASTLAIPATGVFALYAPVVSDLIKKSKWNELNVQYKEVSRNMFFIGMLLFSCIVVGIEDLFKLLPTYDKLKDSIPIIYILGSNVVINMLTSLNGEIISFSKYYRFNLVSILVLMVLSVFLNYWFLTQTEYGILGVAYASLISLSLFNLGKTIYVYLTMKLWPLNRISFYLIFSMFLFLIIALYLPQSESVLLNLFSKISVVLVLNSLLIFKTQWLLTVRRSLHKVLLKLKNRSI